MERQNHTDCCAQHEAIMENNRSAINTIKTELEEVKQERIKPLEEEKKLTTKFRAQAQIVGVICLIIFGSSFLYTQNHIVSSDISHTKLETHIKATSTLHHTDVDEIKDKMYNLNALVQVTDERYKSIKEDLKELKLILAEKEENSFKYFPPTGAGNE